MTNHLITSLKVKKYFIERINITVIIIYIIIIILIPTKKADHS